jgi:polar amino acid transport system ATP-binding protein
MTAPMIRAEHVSKHYGPVQVLRDVSLDVQPGKVCCLLGPSGAGKSTFLRCVNHLDKIDGGRIMVDGDVVGYHERGDTMYEMKPRRVGVQRSSIGMVFQNFNLFSHMTALQNVTFPQTAVHKRDKEAAQQKSRELLDRVGLGAKADKYPRQLSGGEQQRVAIARALAIDPKLILFDEPTSALDPELVGEVLQVIRGVAEDGLTLLIVTHEIQFAREVADQVVFMDGGVVVEDGAPADVLVNPREERTQSFLERVL